ncbi:MAG: hypothetical protein LQ352_002434 [Teloschistes flavicans]|nr:MAG: hypothetical protein LQ352_002434 [Teloschistes flavicans]
MSALYDTFLVQEPLRQDPFAVTHNPSDTSTLIDVYNKSIEYFAEGDRRRAVERLQYELGKLYMREGEWEKGLKVLEPLWRRVSWRREGWWELLALLVEAVRECAHRLGNKGVLLEVEWELMSSSFKSTSLGPDYDFSTCLERIDVLEEPMVIRREDQFPSPLSTTCAFGALQGNVGEVLPVQIVVTSNAQESTAPLTVSQILISFDGGLKDVCIAHKSESEPQWSQDDMQAYDIALITADRLTDSSLSLSANSPDGTHGVCDLTFRPGKRKVISFQMVPRNSGIVRVTTITLKVQAKPWVLDFTVSEADFLRQADFLVRSREGIGRKPAGSNGSKEIRIHPKPPKLQIRLPALRKEYLTDETATLDMEIVNEEDGDAEVRFEARFLGQAEAVPIWSWNAEDAPSSSSEDSEPKHMKSEIRLGRIEKARSRKVQGTFTARSLPAEAILEIKSLYTLLSEPDTPLSKVSIHDIIFDRPFEATYDFQPRVDPEPWPSYFSVNDEEEHGEGSSLPFGLRQLWCCTARLASFASAPLLIEHIDLEATNTPDGAICSVSKHAIPQTLAVAPNSSQKIGFQITVQKFDLDDRRSTTVSFLLRIRWRREQSDSAPAATTTIQCPNLTVPFGEPRVLASIAASPTQKAIPEALSTEPDDESNRIIPITYIIENPSTHVLNFAVSMDTSDDFAFSGPKTTSVTLVPMGRETVRYRILPMKRGGWITPGFRVLDIGFQQVLKVWGTGGLRNDKGGAAIWVDADE